MSRTELKTVAGNLGVAPALNDRLIVLKKTGALVRFLHLNGNGAYFNIRTTGQTKGHSSAADAFSVAAVDVFYAGGSKVGAANPVESFSSDGPRRVFYNANGTLANAGNPSLLSDGGVVRQKPDITAADGWPRALLVRPFFGDLGCGSSRGRDCRAREELAARRDAGPDPNGLDLFGHRH